MSGKEKSKTNITKTVERNKTRRSEADIRNEHLDKGAILLKFEFEDNAESLTSWRNVEKFGFRITTSGCLFSHKNFWFRSRPKIVASDVSLLLFKNLERPVKTSNNNVKRNKYGWPCNEQVSHLCHNSNCCNPNHLVIEPQWKNLKRNYCGYGGECDCGNDIKCISRYYNSNFEREFEYLSYSSPNLKRFVQDSIVVGDRAVGVTVLERNRYDIQDRKRMNRKKRKRGERKMKKESKKKRRKLNK